MVIIMLKANEAKVMAEIYEENRKKELAKQIEDFCEKEINPEIEKTAKSGGTFKCVFIPKGISVSEVVKYIKEFGYDIRIIDRAIEVRW